MTSTVDGVFHAAVCVSDMDRALTFYRDALGLAVTFDAYHDAASIEALWGVPRPVLHSVVVQCPDQSEIELVQWERPEGGGILSRPPTQPGLLSLNLRVSGIDALVDRLVAGGYRVSSDVVDTPLPDGGRIKVAVCHDPDGTAIVLVDLPAGRGSLAAPAP